MDKEKFVQNVKYYCKLKGVKPTPACRDAGVGNSFINSIERGQTPSVGAVQRLAKYLGITTSELLGEKITFGEGDENNPAYRELRYIIDNASSEERRRFLDLIRMYKGFEDEAAERRKKSSSAQSEAAEEEKEQAFECGMPMKAGVYRCAGCGQTTFVIHEQGKTIPPCGICNSNYFLKIT